MARTMGPTTPPEVVLQLRVTHNLSLSFEHFVLFIVVCKTLKFVLLAMFVPLEGLCYLCSHVPFLLYALWTRLFALRFRRCGMPEQ